MVRLVQHFVYDWYMQPPMYPIDAVVSEQKKPVGLLGLREKRLVK